MLKLIRYYFGDNLTLGRLYKDDVFFAYTLEDTDRKLELYPNLKIHGHTAIPLGEYDVTVTYSNRFKRPLPLISCVVGFEGVRFHGGNTEKDTEGCPLVGAKTNGVSNVFECKKKVEELTKYITEKKSVKLVIEREQVMV